MIEGEEKELVIRRILRNGRRRYDAASKARLVATSLEPGVSVSRLALDNGINANLLRKWIKQAKEAGREHRPSASAFVPVVAAECSLSTAPTTQHGEDRLVEPERPGDLSTPVRMSVTLPNGVKLTLDCGDTDVLTAMIGALGHVQTGR
ncbi:transposase [Agrobacterium arsenijevicii]|uniref:Transposase n=1 Tax=Agrobacterium arsenijevicii TaxID=1585697 RepID=A0ABR5CZD1_9HYPH|nr:transposase [Agrobacterium arsenijevicii]